MALAGSIGVSLRCAVPGGRLTICGHKYVFSPLCLCLCCVLVCHVCLCCVFVCAVCLCCVTATSPLRSLPIFPWRSCSPLPHPVSLVRHLWLCEGQAMSLILPMMQAEFGFADTRSGWLTVSQRAKRVAPGPTAGSHLYCLSLSHRGFPIITRNTTCHPLSCVPVTLPGMPMPHHPILLAPRLPRPRYLPGWRWGRCIGVGRATLSAESAPLI